MTESATEPRLPTDQTEPEPVDDLLPDVGDADRAWLAQQDPPSDLQAADVFDPNLCDGLDEAFPTDAETLWLESVTDRAELYRDEDAARARQRQRAHRHAARTLLDEGPHTSEAPHCSADAEVTDPLAWLAQQHRPSWSGRGLRQALQRMRVDAVVHSDLHSDAYAIPKPLKRYLALRDLSCTFPGCARPAFQCEGDHVVPWPRGATSSENIASECKHHHLAKHAYFTVVRLPDGTMRWTTPTGRSYDRRPRPLLRGW